MASTQGAGPTYNSYSGLPYNQKPSHGSSSSPARTTPKSKLNKSQKSQKSIASPSSPNEATKMAHRPKVTTTLWEDEGTLCFQVEARGVCVARREDNDMINGTKLLNVAGMTRGKRDGILKTEKVRHVVKVGSMHLKGVWIPFDRALSFANREKITDILYPLFVADIKALLYHPTHDPMVREEYPNSSGLDNSNGALASPGTGALASSSAVSTAQYTSPIVSRIDETVQPSADYLQYQTTATPSYALYSDQYGRPLVQQHQQSAQQYMQWDTQRHTQQGHLTQQVSQPVIQGQSSLQSQQLSPQQQFSQQQLTQQQLPLRPLPQQQSPQQQAPLSQLPSQPTTTTTVSPSYNYDHQTRTTTVYAYPYSQLGGQQGLPAQYMYPAPAEAAAYASYYAKHQQTVVPSYPAGYQYYASAVPPTAPASRSTSPGQYATQPLIQAPADTNLESQVATDGYRQQYSQDGN